MSHTVKRTNQYRTEKVPIQSGSLVLGVALQPFYLALAAANGFPGPTWPLRPTSICLPRSCGSVKAAPVRAMPRMDYGTSRRDSRRRSHVFLLITTNSISWPIINWLVGEIRSNANVDRKQNWPYEQSEEGAIEAPSRAG